MWDKNEKNYDAAHHKQAQLWGKHGGGKTATPPPRGGRTANSMPGHRPQGRHKRNQPNAGFILFGHERGPIFYSSCCMAHVIYSGAFGVMKFIQQQAMECFSMDSGGANHVPPLRCRSPRRPVRGLGLGRSSGGALHEHDGHHFYSGPCAPLIYSPKTQIYFIHYAFPGAEFREANFESQFRELRSLMLELGSVQGSEL